MMTSDLEAARSRVAANPDDPDARLILVGVLLSEGGHDEAAGELERLVHHEPPITGPLRGFMIRKIQQLIAAHPQARAVFVSLRDAVEPPSGRAPEPRAYLDWVALNTALGDPERTLGWFDTTYRALPDDPELAALVDRTLARVLMEHGRWADAGRVIRDPLERISQIIVRPQPVDPAFEAMFSPQERARMDDLGRAGRCVSASMFVTAMVAAGRHDDARAIAEYCRSVDDSPEMEAALTAVGAPLPS